MKIAHIGLPDNMTDFISQQPIDDLTEFKRAAFMLYAYIDAGIMSHGKAAELLGVDKFRLINFYDKYGLDYIKDTDRYLQLDDKFFANYNNRRMVNDK